MNSGKSKRNSLFCALFCIFFLTLAHISGISVLVYAALAFYILIVLFSKMEYTIPLFLFFLPWSTVLKPAPTSISFCSIVTILVFVRFFMEKGKVKLKVGTILSMLFILILTVFSSAIHGYDIGTSQIMFALMLLAYPMLIFCSKDKINFEDCSLFFALGVISAAVLSMIFIDNPNLMAYIKVFEQKDIEIVRLCGFYGDPNFYSAQVITAIGCQLLLIVQKKKNVLWNGILAFSLIILGFFSVSKSYFLTLVIMLTLWLYCMMKQNSSKVFKVLFGGGVIFAILFATGVFSGIIDEYIIRFGMAEDARTLTTGRSELWKEYTEFLFNNLDELFLGQGYSSVFNGVHKGSHNTLIQCLYQLGLFGTIGFFCWIVSYVRSLGTVRIKPRYFVFLVVACFSMWMGLDLMFFDDLFLNITIFAIGLQYVSDN